MMKLGIAGFIDDNFGDMILRNCFTKLLLTAMKNLNQIGCSVNVISVSQPDKKLIEECDVICFAGGAMFGRTPQAFSEPIERITDIAEERGIPVVFSSIGMLESEENKSSLKKILNKSCVRAFSVREKAEVFTECAEGSGVEISQVCDPALWTEEVYKRKKRQAEGSRPIVGINAVRGGLFSTYGGNWKLADEEEYLHSLSKALDEAGVDCRFFSNGQTLDCNVLRHFAEKYGVNDDKLICPDTSSELISAIAGFDAVAAIRMHASIISYSLGVPSVNLDWNSKIRDFYGYISRPERVVPPGADAAAKTAELIIKALSEGGSAPDPQLKMSVYRFIFEAMSGILSVENAQIYNYNQVCEVLSGLGALSFEDERDLRVKARRGEARYASLFKSDLSQKAKVRKLDGELKDEKKKSGKLKKEIGNAKKELERANNELKNTRSELEKLTKQNEKMRRELDYLNSRFVVKAYRTLARQGQKLKVNKKKEK